MGIDRIGNWGEGNDVGCVYIFDKEDLNRVGNCWMDGRLRVGDIVLCVGHSGDCFYDYILIGAGNNFVEGIPDSEFGSYTLSNQLKWKPTNKEFHLLCAGESLVVDVLETHPHRFLHPNFQFCLFP
ncbi:hypothetical protein ES703_119232 [subsurface metagenome]